MIDPETLNRYVEWMRDRGVLKLVAEGLEIVLGDEPAKFDGPEDIPPAGDGVQKDPVKGADGLTAEDHMDRYGFVYPDAR